MELFLGAGASLVSHFVNKYVEGEYMKLFIVFVLAFTAAAIYVIIVNTPFWEPFTETLTAAGAFYAFILKRFKK